MDCNRKFNQQQFSEDYNINYYDPCFELCNMKCKGKFSKQLSQQFQYMQSCITSILFCSKLYLNPIFTTCAQRLEKATIELANQIQQALDSHMLIIKVALSQEQRSEVWEKHNEFLMHWLSMLELLGVPLSIINNLMEPGITSLRELCFRKSESPLIAQPIYFNRWNNEDSNRVRSILQDQFHIFKQEMHSISQNAYQTDEYISKIMKEPEDNQIKANRNQNQQQEL